MEQSSIAFDIIIYGLLAAFLIYRLRSVLGRRTGNEPPREPYGRSSIDDNVVHRPDRTRDQEDDEIEDVDLGPAQSGGLGAGLAKIQAADPNFDPDEFKEGATAAFEMIVGAFSAGDRGALRPLLNDQVFANFSAAIDAREAAGETLETTFVGMKSVDMVNAEIQGRTALVTLRFVSEQINVTRDRDGQIVDGSPTVHEDIVDIWTFARNTRSRDPNWTLIATEAPQDA